MNEFTPPPEHTAANPWDHPPESHQDGGFEGAGADYHNLTATNESALDARPESTDFTDKVGSGEYRLSADSPNRDKLPWEMTDAEYRQAGLPFVDELSSYHRKVVRAGDLDKLTEDAYFSTLHVAHRLRQEHADECKQVEAAVAQGMPLDEARKRIMTDKSILVVDYGPGTGARSPFVMEARPSDYDLVHASVQDAHLILGNLQPSDTIKAIANTAAKDDPSAAATYIRLMEAVAPYITTVHPDTGKPSLAPESLRKAFKALDSSTEIFEDPEFPKMLSRVIGKTERQNNSSAIATLSAHLSTSFKTNGSGMLANTRPGDEAASPVKVFSIGVPPGGGVTHATEVAGAGNLTIAALSGTDWGQPRHFVGLNFDCLPPEQQKEIRRTLNSQKVPYDLTMGEIDQDNSRALDGALMLIHSPVSNGDATNIEQALPRVSRLRVKSDSNSVNGSDGASAGIGTNTGSEYGTPFDKTGGGSDNSGDSGGLSLTWQQSTELEHNAPAVDASEMTNGMQGNHILVVDEQGNIRGYFDGRTGRLAPGSPIDQRPTPVDLRPNLNELAVDLQNLRRVARGLAPLAVGTKVLPFLDNTDLLPRQHGRPGQSQLSASGDRLQLTDGTGYPPHASGYGSETSGYEGETEYIRAEVRERPETPQLKNQRIESPRREASAIARDYVEAGNSTIYGLSINPAARSNFVRWVRHNKYNGAEEDFPAWVAERWPKMAGAARRLTDRRSGR